MKTRYIWVIGMGLMVGLIAGCEDNKTQQPVAMAPTTVAPEPAPAPYPEPTLEPSQPAAPAPAHEPAVVTGPPAGDTYNPPPPVDTTPIPPEEPPAARAPRPAPRNSYAPAAPRAGQTYTVRRGDTLQKISRRFYGTTTRWRSIFEANRGTIKDPDKLVPGMKLFIPAR